MPPSPAHTQSHLVHNPAHNPTHTLVVSLLGGLAFLVAIAATASLWVALDAGASRHPLTAADVEFFAYSPLFVAIACIGLFIAGSLGIFLCVVVGTLASKRGNGLVVTLACLGLALLTCFAGAGIVAGKYLRDAHTEIASKMAEFKALNQAAKAKPPTPQTLPAP
jgi:hypothetical protein